MEELVWLARGVMAVSVAQFLAASFGIEKVFGTWELDRRTLVVSSLIIAFIGMVLLAIGGAA